MSVTTEEMATRPPDGLDPVAWEAAVRAVFDDQPAQHGVDDVFAGGFADVLRADLRSGGAAALPGTRQRVIYDTYVETARGRLA